MSARDIALALAGRCAHRLPNGSYLVPCPVPSHGRGRGDRNPSLRLADGDKCLLVHCFADCDARDVLDALRRRGLLENFQNGERREYDHRRVAAQNGDGRKLEVDERARKHVKWAREIWHAARNPRGTVVEDYLHSRRLKLDDNLARRVLRFLHRCPWLSESGERVGGNVP